MEKWSKIVGKTVENPQKQVSKMTAKNLKKFRKNNKLGLDKHSKHDYRGGIQRGRQKCGNFQSKMDAFLSGQRR